MVNGEKKGHRGIDCIRGGEGTLPLLVSDPSRPAPIYTQEILKGVVEGG
nr:MAG TPA: hypothetical protein [Caudoviricetes sp.]